jgi:hypothetical protein
VPEASVQSRWSTRLSNRGPDVALRRHPGDAAPVASESSGVISTLGTRSDMVFHDKRLQYVATPDKPHPVYAKKLQDVVPTES